jgi:hypothetical protein
MATTMTTVSLLNELIKREGVEGVIELLSLMKPSRTEVVPTTDAPKAKAETKRKPGRPRLTEEEKAQRKAVRAAAKPASDSDTESHDTTALAAPVAETVAPVTETVAPVAETAVPVILKPGESMFFGDLPTFNTAAPKRKPGRPRLTDEEKAKRKAARVAAKSASSGSETDSETTYNPMRIAKSASQSDDE